MSDNQKLLLFISAIILLIFGGILINNNLTKNPNPSLAVHGNSSQNQANLSNNYNFAAQEIPTFNFSGVAYASDLKNNTSVYNSKGEKMETNINASTNGNGSSIQVKPAQQFVPGKYSLVIDQNGKKIEQDFTWGVLAINTNKSIFAPGEIATLALAVLNEKGDMVCNANVTLEIKDPTGKITTLSVDNGKIIVNPECSQKSFTVNPDYEAKYKVGPSGSYQMSLTAVTAKGTYNIVDFFTVDETAAFDIERIIATRIYPYSIYPVSINITAKEDFSGKITERAPVSFTITPLENTTAYSSIQQNQEAQYISWDVSLKKGQTINIGYNFKAPLISPQFYLLGPLSLSSGSTVVFTEKRAWQLAIDATSYYSTIRSTSGLVAYWRLGETSGTTAVDQQGNLNLTYTGGYTLGVPPLLLTRDGDRAVSFNGTSGNAYRFTDTVLPNGNGARTVEAWANTSSSATNIQIFGYGTASTNEDFSLGMNNGYVYYLDHSQGHSFTGGQFNDGLRHHFVFTYDGTTLTSYVDGTQNGSGWTPSTLNTIRSDVHIGVWSGYWSGTIDEVAVYNVALSSMQVAQHYAAGYPKPYLAAVSGENGLVSYWRLGESSGTTAYDEVGAYNGTYSGSPTLGVQGAIAGDSNTAVNFYDPSVAKYVSVNNSIKSNFSSGCTMEAWYLDQPGVLPNDASPVGWGDGSNGAFIYLTNSGGHATVTFYVNTISSGTWTDTTNMLASGWHHLVGTWDGSYLRLYIDGALVEGPVANTTAPAAGTANFQIANYGFGSKFNGSVDEVAVYKRGLTPAEIALHYAAGNPSTYQTTIFSEPSLVSYWRLGELSGPALDSVASNDAGWNGSPALGQAGAIANDSNTSVRLNPGSTQWAGVVAPVGLPTGSQARTLEAWVKLDGLQTNGNVLIWGKPGLNQGALGLCVGSGTNTDDLCAQDYFNGWDTLGGHLNDGKWHYVAMTYAAGGTTVIGYIDGVQSGTATIGTPITGSDNLDIGNWNSGYNGWLDELAIYNDVLSPAKIMAHYQAGEGTPMSDFLFQGLKLQGIKIN